MDASDDEHSNALTQEREFSSVIQDLRTNYTNDKMSEISTSFCFICLLHLANEQGLKIEVGGNEGKLEALPEEGAEGAEREEEGQREEVGNLEALKVWKVSRRGSIGSVDIGKILPLTIR
jgi:condensin complex subunit 2